MHYRAITEAVGTTNKRTTEESYPMMTKQPTHAAIRAGDKMIVVPVYRLEIVLGSLTSDDLCGIYSGYCYSGSDARKLNPDQISQELEISMFRPEGVEGQKSAQLQAELDSSENSKRYYSERATKLEKELKELQEKVDSLLAAKPEKAD